MAVIHLHEPGRPRTVTRRRSARVQERVAAFNEGAARFVDADQLFRAAKSGDDLEPLYLAREELAREAASLHFARLQAVPGSREMGRIATRRISALREIASLTLAIARADTAMPAPERLARIVGSSIEVVEQAAANVLPSEAAGKFRETWRARIEPYLKQLRVEATAVDVLPAVKPDE